MADTGNSRIQKLTAGGVYVARWGTRGSANGQFNTPSGVAVDASGAIYVSDSGNKRIQVFGVLPVSSRSTSWGRLKALYR